jgi:hypothetical protein
MPKLFMVAEALSVYSHFLSAVCHVDSGAGGQQLKGMIGVF